MTWFSSLQQRVPSGRGALGAPRLGVRSSGSGLSVLRLDLRYLRSMRCTLWEAIMQHEWIGAYENHETAAEDNEQKDSQS